MPTFRVRVLKSDGDWRSSECVARDEVSAAWVSAEREDPRCETALLEVEVAAVSEQRDAHLPVRRFLVLPDGGTISRWSAKRHNAQRLPGAHCPR